jgi:hypothetical protein
MEIIVTGTQRETNISLEKLVAHQKTIAHWLNGADIEEYEGSMWVSTTDHPDFLTNTEYRAVNIQPKAGEIWEDGSLYYLAVSSRAFISLCGNNIIESFNNNWSKKLTYSSPSITTHMAKELIKNAPKIPITFFLHVKELAESNSW